MRLGVRGRLFGGPIAVKERWRRAGAALAAAVACLVVATMARAQSASDFLLNPVAENVSPEVNRFGKPVPTSSKVFALASPQQPSTQNDDAPAPSRVGRIPEYGLRSASGAGETGYDSRNLKRKKKKPRAQSLPSPSKPRQPVAPPSALAHRARVASAMAGTVEGQPRRRALKVDGDPFGATGFYAGTFLVTSAVELSGGYDTNPTRTPEGKGAWFYVIAPELIATSDWSRHALKIDLRGAFYGYPKTPDCGCLGPSTVPATLNRPDFTGRIVGRVDVTRDTQIDTETRLRVATDNPGSPEVGVGLTRYPIYASVGGTLGATQRLNRLELSAGVSADRTVYQESSLTNGSTASNSDRNFNQYAVTTRAAYELTPGIKPFVEASFDRREHDEAVDRNGIARDSRGTTARVGTTFELTRLLTGSLSVGYQIRDYVDPTLASAQGLLADASLVWSATPLTSLTLKATSSIDESTLAGVSGVVTRQYSAQVDHSFRRWLIGTARFAMTTQDYDGSSRIDHGYAASAALTYKLTRTAQIKSEFRQEWLRSNAPGSDYTASVFLLGLRFQR